MPRRFLAFVLLTLALSGIAFSIAACGDDDDGGGVEVIGETPGAEPDPEPDPEADPVAEVTPAPPPAGASQIEVTLSEWTIAASPASVAAGQVYFLVENAGPDDAHEFVVIKSDLAADALPTEDGRVPEDEVDLLDEIEPFAPGSTASLALDLEPGAYVLICNIAEGTDSGIESHYGLGMRLAFKVE